MRYEIIGAQIILRAFDLRSQTRTLRWGIFSEFPDVIIIHIECYGKRKLCGSYVRKNVGYYSGKSSRINNRLDFLIITNFLLNGSDVRSIQACTRFS